MRDWQTSLWPASWNGFPFHVDRDTIKVGSRLHTHAIPNGGHVVENFGRNLRKFEVTAYLVNDNVDVQGRLLLSLLETGEPGTLLLPDHGPVNVQVSEGKRDFEKDKLGYAAFSIEAQEVPVAAGFSLSADALENLVYAAADTARTALGAMLANALVGLGQSGPVADAAVTAGIDAIAVLDSWRLAARLTPAADRSVATSFAALPDALAMVAYAPATFGEALATAARALGQYADPGVLAAAFADEIAPPDVVLPVVSGGLAPIAAANATILSRAAYQASVIGLAESTVARVFSDRNEAVAARALVSMAATVARDGMTGTGLDLGTSLETLRGLVAACLTARIADLAPIVDVSSAISLPAVVWAWALYGDPSRAIEVAARAGAPHPSFLPTRFSAVSR